MKVHVVAHVKHLIPSISQQRVSTMCNEFMTAFFSALYHTVNSFCPYKRLRLSEKLQPVHACGQKFVLHADFVQIMLGLVRLHGSSPNRVRRKRIILT